MVRIHMNPAINMVVAIFNALIMIISAPDGTKEDKQII